MVALLMRLVQGPGCSRLAGGRKPRRHAGGAAPPTKASWKCRIPFTRHSGLVHPVPLRSPRGFAVSRGVPAVWTTERDPHETTPLVGCHRSRRRHRDDRIRGHGLGRPGSVAGRQARPADQRRRHASDVTQCIQASLCPNIATFMARGTSYSNVTTSEPSDSSPGIVALTTGASPKLSGVYYDDSYDRTMFTPPAQTPTSTQDCSGAPGAETQYFENLD